MSPLTKWSLTRAKTRHLISKQGLVVLELWQTQYIINNDNWYITTSSLNLSNYRTVSVMGSYLTIYSASATYQPIWSMSSYLATSASSTYQTISGMSSYLTTSETSTYQPISSTVYLTTTSTS